ncbi:MAG: nucleotidyltransferase domain-containing protein [Armatimonadetes bacterium]|nr:nucleotidyltransferase domain-containing protein [Armatimonadota bacterium]
MQDAAARLPHPPLFVTVSGAHLYGFASPDSDFDLRGAHILPLRELVGLNPPRETVEISEIRDGLEWDIVSHDARKFFALLLKNSGYALEQAMSPLVVVSTSQHEELKAIARKCHNRHFARHYFGFAENQWRLFEKKAPRVKPLLYIYRVLLTGIHLMRSGELECNLVHLNEIFEISVVNDLIAMKTATQEQIELPDADMGFYRAEYDRLRALLVEAEADSPLPQSADVREELNDLLLRLRLGRKTAQGSWKPSL